MSKRQAASIDDTTRSVDSQTQSKVFAVWGPKGGVGRTFLAVNLAVALTAGGRRRVLLMDGCLGFCTADVALDIEGNKTIFDLVVEHDEDLDPELVEQVVVHHASGIDVLLAPHVENMLLLAPAQLQRILRVMRRLYDCIVIDTRPLLDETTVAFLDLSDVILTVCAPEIASLRNLRVFLDAASHLGYSASKIQLVINRFDMRGAITQDEIERVCRCRVTYNIPNDHEAVSTSINQGKPLVSLQPTRPISKEIGHLAALLLGNQGDSQPSDPKSRKVFFNRLFGHAAQR
jgi:pilus assembly protein CpaE